MVWSDADKRARRPAPGPVPGHPEASRFMTLEEEIEARERALRNLVEERIQAAMQAGAFDNLPGKGKPLQLEENPFVPPELRLAYKVLANANMAPEWIELDKAIRTSREELKLSQGAHIAWLAEQRRRLADELAAGDDGALAQTLEFIRARHDRFRADLEQRIRELNRRIDELNLIVPHLSLQRPRLNVAETLSALDEAARAAFPQLFR